jgi:hypothetical protein
MIPAARLGAVNEVDEHPLDELGIDVIDAAFPRIGWDAASDALFVFDYSVDGYLPA